VVSAVVSAGAVDSVAAVVSAAAVVVSLLLESSLPHAAATRPNAATTAIAAKRLLLRMLSPPWSVVFWRMKYPLRSVAAPEGGRSSRPCSFFGS
jgi:hypothetical protein